jgi:hypothetical protein
MSDKLIASLTTASKSATIRPIEGKNLYFHTADNLRVETWGIGSSLNNPYLKRIVRLMRFLNATTWPISFNTRIELSEAGTYDIRYGMLMVGYIKIETNKQGEHTRDEDCVLDKNQECIICHVDHSSVCYQCGGHGFHKENCERKD